jgi:hypothetical protein
MGDRPPPPAMRCWPTGMATASSICFWATDRPGMLAADQLFFGKGDGTFTEVTKTSLAGANPARPTNGLVTCDYDNDGDLDIFVSTYGVSVELGQDISVGKRRQGSLQKRRGRAWLCGPRNRQLLAGHAPGAAPTARARQAGRHSYMGGNGFGLDCQDHQRRRLRRHFPDQHLASGSETQTTPASGAIPRCSSSTRGRAGKYSFVNEFLKRAASRINEGDVDGSTVDFDNDGRFEVAMSRDTKYEGSASLPWSIRSRGLASCTSFPTESSKASATKAASMTSSQMPLWKRMKGAQNHAWSDIDHDGAPDLLVGGRDQGGGRPNFLFRNKSRQPECLAGESDCAVMASR